MRGLSYENKKLPDFALRATPGKQQPHLPAVALAKAGWLSSLESVNNPSFGEVVGSHLYFDLITHIEADIIHAHFARQMRHDLVFVLKCYSELCSWQELSNPSLNFYSIFSHGEKLSDTIVLYWHNGVKWLGFEPAVDKIWLKSAKNEL